MKISSNGTLSTIGQSAQTKSANYIENFKNASPSCIPKNQEIDCHLTEILEKYKQGENSEAVLELFVKQELQEMLNGLTPKLQDEITSVVHKFLINDRSTLANFERCLSGLC